MKKMLPQGVLSIFFVILIVSGGCIESEDILKVNKLLYPCLHDDIGESLLLFVWYPLSR